MDRRELSRFATSIGPRLQKVDLHDHGIQVDDQDR